MASKLTFNDLENQELDPSKLNFIDSSTLSALGSGVSDPSMAAVVGALYVNTVSGDVFRKITVGATAANWRKISSITTTVMQNRYRDISVSAITSSDATAPSIGDMVAYCGAGAWSSIPGTAMSVVRQNHAGSGSQNAAFVAGGRTSPTLTNATEVFNGSSWAASAAVLSIAKENLGGAGSQNAGLVAGGLTSSVLPTNATELFNGTGWALATGVLSSVKRDIAAWGVQNAAMISGGQSTASFSSSEIFNGSGWSASSVLSVARYGLVGAGSQNAGLVTGGPVGANGGATELFNGSSWITSGSISLTRLVAGGAGSQNSAIIMGGSAGGAANRTDIFNGSNWVISGNLIQARQGLSGAGSQNASLAAGGSDGGSALASSELHNQTIFRKVFAKNLPEANVIGVLSSASIVMLQGTNTSVTYPANKYLMANKNQNSAITNFANLSNIAVVSVLGSPPTMTYNFSTTFNLLSVVPGNVAIISGGTISLSNSGSFIISRVISPSSIEVQNANGVNENPITGTLSILNSIVATDNISPQDIVLGRTDINGLLTIPKPLTIGSPIKRLK